MVEHICGQLDEMIFEDNMDIEYYVDGYNNVYVTKGDNDYYPCYIAHTDTVHEIDSINVERGQRKKPFTFGKDFGESTYDVLYAINNEGNPTGIGGDDKAGIFICLELLRTLDNCKVAFFVSEEIGCIGSKEADVDFFDDVSFVCQYDAPGDHLITEVCSGVRMYEKNGEFIDLLKPVIESSYGNQMYEQSHPFTDVMEIKKKTDVSCINLSCGYYNMHTKDEFICIDDVERAINAGIGISEFGLDSKFYYEVEPTPIFTTTSADDSFYDYDDGEWISDEVIVFDEGNYGISIEEYESKSVVSLTEKETLKLYRFLKDRFEGEQLKLF
jgi:hypothetical protein